MRTNLIFSFSFLMALNLAAAEDRKPDPVPLRNWPVLFDRVVRTPAAAGRLQPVSEALPSQPATFIAIPPCRVADTRNANGPYGGPALAKLETRAYNIHASPCAPPIAAAYSLNFTIVGYTGNAGFLSAFPGGTGFPGVSTLNFGSGPALANAAVVPADATGSINVLVSDPTNVIIDVNGYFLEGGPSTGTSANNPNTLVLRDGTGSFAAGTITATKVLGAVYQDLAEWVPSSPNIPPGTVVVLDPADGRRVIASSHAYDAAVAGVVSESPGILLGVAGSNKSQIATTGRVRVLVDADVAPVRIGDLLVTSDVPGAAMRSQPMTIDGQAVHRAGTIIGKALEPLPSGKRKILMLLSLQ